MSPDDAALLVRVTARISATRLAVSLVVAARRLAVGSGGPDGPAGSKGPGLRKSDIAAFAGLVVSHTIHFGCVMLLAKRRPAPRWAPDRQRRTEVSTNSRIHRKGSGIPITNQKSAIINWPVHRCF